MPVTTMYAGNVGTCAVILGKVVTNMQRLFAAEGFHAKVKPAWYLTWATLSQTGMSFVQQGIIVMGFLFAVRYHLDFAEIGLVTTSMSLGMMASMVFMGMLADRWGPRRLLRWGAVVMAVLAALLTQIRGFDSLLGMFFLLGISLAAVPMAGTKAVFTAFQNRARGMPMGIRQTGVPLGAALAAMILPVLALHEGLNAVYGLFAVELFVVGWIFSSVIEPSVKAPAAVPKVQSKLPRSLWTPATVSVLMVAGQYFLITFTLEYLHRFRHFTLSQAGFALALAQIGGGIGRIVFGAYSDRTGANRPRTISQIALLAFIMVGFVVFLPQHIGFGWICLVWFLMGMGAIGWNALSLTWAAETVLPEQAGMAMGFVGTVVFLGSAFFPPILGAVIDSTHHFRPAWGLLAGILLGAGLLAYQASKPLRLS
ncbi:MAG: MFS transporter [Sulfobacillus thermotolerans]|nr:MFS transporter [Sulfobacillus thermotolerans]